MQVVCALYAAVGFPTVVLTATKLILERVCFCVELYV